MKYFAWGDDTGPVPKELGNPKVTVKMSRVGFNRRRNEALAYFAWLSASPARTFFGEYVHLKRGPEGWSVVGRKRSWTSNIK
jgi:hypothetical protein